MHSFLLCAVQYCPDIKVYCLDLFLKSSYLSVRPLSFLNRNKTCLKWRAWRSFNSFVFVEQLRASTDVQLSTFPSMFSLFFLSSLSFSFSARRKLHPKRTPSKLKAITAPFSHERVLDVRLCGASLRAQYLQHMKL